MAKTQKLGKEKDTSLLFFAFAAVIILVSYLLLSPRVSSMLFPFRRTIVWNNFLSEAKSSNSIDPQKYWEFREFYSPGYFDLKTTGLDKDTVQETIKELGVPINQRAITLPFAKFTSSRITSLDSLTTETSLHAVLQKDIPQSQVLMRNATSIIYTDGLTTKIIFVIPESEMKKAVGFFDYEGKDKDLTNGKHWVNITSVKRD